MDELARAMADAAEDMAAAESLVATSLVAVSAACRLIPGVEHASVSLARRGIGIDTIATSGELPTKVDATQVELGEGPCIEAAWEDTIARLPDTTEDQRWPRFSARAHELGVGSMLAFQLSLDEAFEEERIGALNTYSSRPDGYTRESEVVGLILAVHVSVAVAFAERHEQMRDALAGRDLIGQAKGVLMAKQQISADLAFDLMVRRSRDTNTRLREVAATIVGV